MVILLKLLDRMRNWEEQLNPITRCNNLEMWLMSVALWIWALKVQNMTWSRHFKNGNSIWEQLDRCLATNSWFLKFPRMKVYHLRCDSSYHNHIHTVFLGIYLPTRKKLFRFEEMWLSNTGCEEVVQAPRTSVGDFGSEEAILAKVEKCGKDLSWWNKIVFGNVRRELDRLKKNLAKAKIEAMTSGNYFWIR